MIIFNSNYYLVLVLNRVLKVGKKLLSIVEMENKVDSLSQENSILQTKEETLRIEKKTLTSRLEESENMLKKYITEMKNHKNNDNSKDSEDVVKLKKENKVIYFYIF